jgi:hypothetical protein
MTSENTLKTALALIAKPDDTAPSAFLLQTRDELDIAGTEAAIGELQERRRALLLDADDGPLEAIDAEIAAAVRGLDRRKAAFEALKPLIATAHERERQEALDRLGEANRDTRRRVLQAYVDLDRAALRVVELLDTIRAGEAAIAGANLQLREAGKAHLMVGLPMAELSMLTGTAGEFLPLLSHWRLHGYTDHPEGRLGDAWSRAIVPERRFGRLAELLPDAKPAKKAVA